MEGDESPTPEAPTPDDLVPQEGKYDGQLDLLRASLGAKGAFLMVFGDENVTGFSFVAEDNEAYRILHKHMPGVMRDLADLFLQGRKPIITLARN
jgi:hypothetical protein